MGNLCSSGKTSDSPSPAPDAKQKPSSSTPSAPAEKNTAPIAKQEPSSSTPSGPAEKKTAPIAKQEPSSSTPSGPAEKKTAPIAKQEPSSSTPSGPAEKKTAPIAKQEPSSSAPSGPAEKKTTTSPATPSVCPHTQSSAHVNNNAIHSSSGVPNQDAPTPPEATSFPQSSPFPSRDAQTTAAIEDVDLGGLIQHISGLLERIKKKSSLPTPSTRQYWPTSSTGLTRLKEILREGTEGASTWKDIAPGKMNIFRTLVNGISELHWAAACLLVVANVLERYETICANKYECLCLLEEMYNLAHHIKKLKARPKLREEMEASIQNATELILEGSFMCCTQIDSSKFSKFLLTYVNEDELLKFQRKLKRMSKRMENEMGICIYDAIECRMERPQKERERTYPEYAVGIEEPLHEVIQLLDWKNEKNAVAVILHGFGGIGKTVLADAVFARLYIEGCKYSMVRLDDITSNPDIVELQKCILKDLSIKAPMGMTDKQEEIGHLVLENIRTFEDGQREIGRMLEKEIAFIYIDNVVHGDRLEQILPRDMKSAKKLRLLITARDINECTGCRMEKKVYATKCLPKTEAMNLLRKEMNGDRMNETQMEQIVKTCGGVPKLLTLVAGFIRSDEDKVKAFRIVMEDAEKFKGKPFGNIDRYVFAFDNLPEICKDPFLDVCFYFSGWDWDTVADIVGQSELDMLEKRALVTRDTNRTVKIHDIILTIGLNKGNGRRHTFTGASAHQIQEFLMIKDLQGVKGLWFSRTKDPFYIPAQKLNLMYNSLRILALGNSTKVEETCNKAFEKLVFFQGEISYLPFNVSWSKELRYLKWQPQDLNLLKEMPSSLKHMELDGKLHFYDFEIFSSDLQQLRNLRILRLIHFAGLKKLPEELGDLLNGLEELTLSYSESIVKLPSTISKLHSLKVLRMDNCSNLKGLPEDFGSLTSLQELNLSYCSSIPELPRSTIELQSLRRLTLSYCTSIQELPKSISKLHSLKVLRMDSCSNLKGLPEDFGSLSSLEELNLSNCKSIKELSVSILKLQSLRIVRLNYCSGLEWLPDFGVLRSLQELELEGCEKLELQQREPLAPRLRNIGTSKKLSGN